MILNVFMDETSRTGQERFAKGTWNFSQQPYFGLSAIYVPESNREQLNQQLDDIIKGSKIPGEFKWLNRRARGKIQVLFPKIMDVISKNNAILFFEIEDKRFSIAKYITEYCIIPYYCYDPDERNTNELRAYASYISDHLSDRLLGDACRIFDSNEHTTTELKELIHSISEELGTLAIRRNCSNTIQTIEMFESGELPNIQITNLFPLMDPIVCHGEDKELSIDPHTDCFSDLLRRAIVFYPQYRTIKCIHDEQTQWKPALEKTIERIKMFYSRNHIIDLSFWSGYHAIINTVDYISGYLNSHVKNLLGKDTPLPTNLHDLCNSRLHLVTSITMQEKLWKNDPEIKAAKILYDTIGWTELPDDVT